MSSTVLCAGIVVADLFVPPLPRLPAAGELLATDDFLLESGGCAANTAACLARLGVAAGVAGTIGCDSFGDFVAADLSRKGIDTAGLTRSADHGTAKTVILPVTGEDRRYIHTVGANAAFTAAAVDRHLLAGARVLYLGGFLVLPALQGPGLVDLLRAARTHGLRVILDVVVPAGASAALFPALAAVLPDVDLFLPNAEEAAALTGLHDPRDQAERFLAAGCRAAIITKGALGAVLVTPELVADVAAPRVTVVDGSGAGDAFAAGCIVGLLEGWDLPRSLRFASAIGASACTKLGCLAGVFTRGEAEAYLALHPLEVRTAQRAVPAMGPPPSRGA